MDSCKLRWLLAATLGIAAGLLVAGWLAAGEPQRLTTDGLTKFTATFTSDGREIVYVDYVRGALYRLQRLDLATGKVTLQNPQATTSEFEPAFSADGRYFAYCRLRGLLNIHVVIRELESGKEVEVSPGEGLVGMRTPAFAPDGSRLVYSLAERSRQHLFSVDLQGNNRQPLTDAPGITIAPSFSPDGQRVVCSSTRDGNYEIYTLDPDGKNVSRLTDSPYQDLRPCWSPDGKRIAFTSHRDGNPEVYVMNADGSEPRRLTDHPERDDYPAWHPDGRLLIVSERDGQFDLYLHDVQP
jgi:Tol biopolymer transport system component